MMYINGRETHGKERVHAKIVMIIGNTTNAITTTTSIKTRPLSPHQENLAVPTVGLSVADAPFFSPYEEPHLLVPRHSNRMN